MKRVAALLVALLTLGVGGLQAQEWQTLAAARERAGEERLDATIQHGAGTLRLGPADASQLYTMHLRYDAESFEPVHVVRDEALHLGLRRTSTTLRRTGERGSSRMEVGLSPSVPLALQLDFGAGRAEVELGGLRLVDLDLRTGASETRVDVSRPNPLPLPEATFAVGAAHFTGHGLANLNAERIAVEAGVGEVVLDLSGDWRRDLDLTVQMGVGSLELHLPRGIGVRLTKESLLTDLDAPEMRRDGNRWFSGAWGSAERTLTIDVQASFGSVTVHWIDAP